MQYAGRSLTLKPEEKLEVNESCGNHLLNNYGQRGLTFLKYNDNEEKVGKDAIDRNKTFKMRMVGEYNQRNEQRKMMGLGYLPPTKKLREYALDLSVALIEPYTMKDVEKEAISKSTEENIALKKDNEELRKDMEELKSMLNLLMEGKTKKIEEDSSNSEEKTKGNQNWKKKDG